MKRVPDDRPYHPVAHGHRHSHAHQHAPSLQPTAANGPLPRDAGVGRLLYLDAGSGLAGDMLVAALLDLGVPEGVIDAGLAGLRVHDYQLVHSRVLRSSLSGRHFAVVVGQAQPARDYAAIVSLLTAAETLTPGARSLALRAFELLAHAEAQVHACAVEAVHFHEVGAVDSIVDIVAAAIALDHVGAEVVCSPLPLGRGTTRSQHGVIPLPAPATVLCLKDVPTYDAGIAAELVTPTGACLVAAAARRFGGWPACRPERVGLGAGTKDWPDRANILRVVLASPEPLSFSATRSQGLHVVLEANVDDMTPEVAAYALERAMASGALDAWTTPIGMKKGRAASLLSVLCRRDKLDELAKLLLTETSSIGLRHYPVDRIERPRRIVCVDTPYGSIDVKVATGDGLADQVAPEYEACRRAAEAHGVPIRRVYAAAMTAFEAARPTT
ncbi:MAG: nickel pincer cofactor biosynthesis protein LarC [Polyangiales bacterium]